MKNLKKNLLEPPMDFECASKRYETSFQKFIAKNIDRSKMASMIYEVSGNRKRDIGYVKL